MSNSKEHLFELYEQIVDRHQRRIRWLKRGKIGYNSTAEANFYNELIEASKRTIETYQGFLDHLNDGKVVYKANKYEVTWEQAKEIDFENEHWVTVQNKLRDLMPL